MSKKSDDTKKRGRGRPPLGDAIMVPVRLPAAMVDAIDMLVGPGKRAEFIRAAIAREIKRRTGSEAAD